MTKILRKDQKIFAISGGAVGQFGSAEVGSPVLTLDTDTIQALPAYDEGWNSATISGEKRPPLEEDNGIKYLTTYQISYLLQEGIAEYSAGTTYYLGSLVKQTGTSILYKSLINDNLGNALVDGANWQLLGDLADLSIIPTLGTAAFEDTGTTDGTIPVIGAGDKLSNSLLNNASETLSGIVERATDPEVFNKDSTRYITGLSLYNNVFFQEWLTANSVTGLTQAVPTGVVATIGYNLLTSLLEANESTTSNVPINFKDIADSPQLKILNQASNKFLFPSNLNTFNSQYADYFIRIDLILDITSTSNSTSKFYVRLRRVVDDSIVFTLTFSESDFGAQTDKPISGSVPTFVNGESDPFVVDGCYLDILRDNNSVGGNITIKSVDIKIFRN